MGAACLQYLQVNSVVLVKLACLGCVCFHSTDQSVWGEVLSMVGGGGVPDAYVGMLQTAA